MGSKTSGDDNLILGQSSLVDEQKFNMDSPDVSASFWNDLWEEARVLDWINRFLNF